MNQKNDNHEKPETPPAPEKTQDSETGAQDLAARLEASETKAKENREAALRASADLDNYRKRMAREMEELRVFAKSDLVRDLLSALDNLGLGLESARQHHPEATGVIEGFALIYNQLRGILEQHGAGEFNPEGEMFDPQWHEAVAHLPDNEAPEGAVTAVRRAGYTLNGRLLRPAAVVVSSGPPAGPETPPPEPENAPAR